jgi:hypothetical protein
MSQDAISCKRVYVGVWFGLLILTVLILGGIL